MKSAIRVHCFLSMILAGGAFVAAEDAKAPFKSTRACTAMNVCAATQEKIKLDYETKIKDVWKQYEIDLKSALKDAMNDGNLDESTRIQERLKTIEERSLSESEFQSSRANGAARKCDTALKAADKERAARLLTAQKTCVRELDAAVKDATRAGDLEDAKKIRDAKLQLDAQIAAASAPADDGKDKKKPAGGKHPDDAVPHARHFYKVFIDKVSWSEAKARCEGFGGYLACAGNLAENTFLYALMIKALGNDEGSAIWIGGYREGDQWKWVDNSPFRFKNWDKGEPDNSTGNDNYMVLGLLHGGQTWFDRADSNKHAYICEWDQ